MAAADAASSATTNNNNNGSRACANGNPIVSLANVAAVSLEGALQCCPTEPRRATRAAIGGFTRLSKKGAGSWSQMDQLQASCWPHVQHIGEGAPQLRIGREAREQRRPRHQGCSQRRRHPHPSAAAATPAAIEERAASSAAVAAHVVMADPMFAASSGLPARLGMIPYEVFRTFDHITRSYRQHNAALKYWREEMEDPRRPFDSNIVFSPSTRDSQLRRSCGAKGRAGPSIAPTWCVGLGRR